jgi:hypothetical protein
MVSRRASVCWAAGSRKTLWRGWSERGPQRWRTFIQGREASGTEGICPPPPQDRMRVGLRSVISDFPVFHPAPRVGIFRGAFLPPSSSLPCSALGSPGLWLGIPPSQVPPLAHILFLPIVFQGFCMGVPLIFQEFILSSHVLCWLPLVPWLCPRLPWTRVGGPVAIGDTPESVSHGINPTQDWHWNH